MFHFSNLTAKQPLKQVSLLLALTAVLPFTASCQSKGGYQSGDVPYADNIPKTKEEKEYYNDVLSGDWQKDKTSTLGYFGLGKNQVSTTPPPHWGMQPPQGSKTMQEIRNDYYERQNSEPTFASGSAQQKTAVPYRTANTAQTPPDSVKSPANAAPQNQDEKSDSDTAEKEESKLPSFLKGWSRFQPKENQNLIAADESFFPETGLSENAVLRGQAPDTNGTNSNIVSTADAQKVPLKIDPSAADAWKYVDGRGVVRDNVPKDLPSDEYIVIGGDAGGEAFTLPNWDVHNLESDETIAHFDTTSGQIKVEPSNRFVLYAPRFGTVRQTVGPKSESQNTRLTSFGTDIAAAENQHEEGIDLRVQEEKVSQTRANVQTSDIRANQPGGIISGEEGLIEESSKVLTASANSMLGSDTLTDEVKLALTQGAAAAAAWGKTQGVAVQIDKLSAQGNITLQGAATLYSITNDTKTSQLRLFKSASKQEAAPGELIEFTIRYENVGTETIGNVTILDSLSSRLEYLDESAVSSKKADFLVKNNETGSLLLRLEVTDPLEPGDFGVLTFLCKVR